MSDGRMDASASCRARGGKQRAQLSAAGESQAKMSFNKLPV